MCVCVCVLRYIFLFDKVVIVCKRKGYSYELKEIIELQLYKMSDDPLNNRDVKKVSVDASPPPPPQKHPTPPFCFCSR